MVASVGAVSIGVLGLQAGGPASADSGRGPARVVVGGALGAASPTGSPVVGGLRPAIEGPGPNLYAVSAIGSDDAWAVGLAHGLVLSEHWDGSDWSLGHTGMPGGSLSSSFYGVSADASDDVWAVGSFSSQATKSTALVAH